MDPTKTLEHLSATRGESKELIIQRQIALSMGEGKPSRKVL